MADMIFSTFSRMMILGRKDRTRVSVASSPLRCADAPEMTADDGGRRYFLVIHGCFCPAAVSAVFMAVIQPTSSWVSAAPMTALLSSRLLSVVFYVSGRRGAVVRDGRSGWRGGHR